MRNEEASNVCDTALKSTVTECDKTKRRILMDYNRTALYDVVRHEPLIVPQEVLRRCGDFRQELNDKLDCQSCEFLRNETSISHKPRRLIKAANAACRGGFRSLGREMERPRHGALTAIDNRQENRKDAAKPAFLSSRVHVARVY
ncbi:hypothetical protein RRG08_012997 [Elysia crispata]|uniref:Uncharacterized protein n=1 Tax=Elysia crispata TaxID=231223 RepID=A0AAE1DPV8_9GAST|nr:hypothetical protein RRG08_012997 [Elysia crispata]